MPHHGHNLTEEPAASEGPRGPQRVSRRRLPVAVLVAALAAVIAPAAARAEGAASGSAPVSEEAARAAFLFQVAQYVHWPEDSFSGPTEPLRFCVLGRDSLSVALVSTLRDKTIGGRPVAVSGVATAGELSGCHVAYVGYSSGRQLREVFTRWTYPPVLLVGETDRFAQMGGIVNLILKDGRVSFEVNTAAAGRAHLEFRSQLLRFACIVTVPPGEPR